MGLFYIYTMDIASFYPLFLQSKGICTDTRSLTEGVIYVALKGANFNGNKFVKQALKEGAKYAVSDDNDNAGTGNCLVVKDSLVFLQQLANHHRKQLDIPVIGITGTNGKTTTKELLHAVLNQQFNVLATKGNFNNHIGVPLTLLSITKEHEIAIIEMGANHVGEIAELCEIAEPTIGMITNVGKAHLEGFGSFENIIETKIGLYNSIRNAKGTVFVNADDPVLMKHSQNIERNTYGKCHADFDFHAITDSFTIGIEAAGLSIKSKLFGEYNAYNIAAACAIGKYMGVSDIKMKEGIENYTPSNNRSQTIKTEKNTLLLDAYNANPSSMEAALRNFAKMDLPNKVVVLGEMYELGADSESEHKKTQDLCTELNFSNAIYIGNWPEIHNRYESTIAFIEALKKDTIQNSNILIKGSRGIKLEDIVTYL